MNELTREGYFELKTSHPNILPGVKEGSGVIYVNVFKGPNLGLELGITYSIWPRRAKDPPEVIGYIAAKPFQDPYLVRTAEFTHIRSSEVPGGQLIEVANPQAGVDPTEAVTEVAIGLRKLQAFRELDRSQHPKLFLEDNAPIMWRELYDEEKRMLEGLQQPVWEVRMVDKIRH